MNRSQDLYFRLPVLAQTFLINVYAAARYRKRYGRDARSLQQQIRAERALPADAQRESRDRRLAAMLDHALSAVPFYRDHKIARSGTGSAHARLASLPILSKDAVREHQEALRAETVESFWTTETSGSTGTPLRVTLDRYAYRLSMALVAVLEEDLGVGGRDRRATFAGRLVQPVDLQTPPFWRYNWVERQMLFSAYHLSDQTLPAYVDALEAFQPVEIIGYPSAITTVADFILRSRPLRHTPQVIITNSESLLAWQRQTIEQAFRCTVVDYYGAAESVAFAAQCPARRYHPDPTIGVSEVLDDAGRPVRPGDTGRLIATTLSNRAMPLLRYDTGDLVQTADGACPCGREGDTWVAVLGRQDDVIETPSGRRVGRLDHIFKGATGVRECQVAHIRPDALVLRVVRDPSYSRETDGLLIANAHARVGAEMRITVEFVDSIPRTNRGKFRSVVREFTPALNRTIS